MSSARSSLSRRTVLRGGAVALALPWLESLAPRETRAQAAAARKLVALYFPSGVASYWAPTGTGAAWSLSPILQPLGTLKSKTTVLQNVGNYGPFGGHIEPAHGNLTASYLTCVRPNGATIPKAGVSVDQVVAKALAGQTPLPSLQVGLSTLNSYAEGGSGAFSRSISWASDTDALYKLVNPQAVFDRLTLGGPGPAPVPGDDFYGASRAAARKSVLDFVSGHATGVRAQLSSSDRQRMDQFLTSVRETEQRLSTVTPGSCITRPRPTETYNVGNVPPDYNRNAHAELMIDLVVLALQCGLTRVVSFMLDDARSEFPYGFLTKRTFTPSGSAPTTGVCKSPHEVSHAGDADHEYATISWWYVSKLASLCNKLDAIPDGAGTMLDSSVVWFGSEMHGGNHDALDLPLLYVGGGGGTLKTDTAINFANTPRGTERLANVYLTLVNKVFGLNVASFGTGATAPATSTLPAATWGAGTDVVPEILKSRDDGRLHGTPSRSRTIAR